MVTITSNPSITEIRTWAFSDENLPAPEWDLYLIWKDEILLFLELAIDHKCNKQNFFKYLLYFMVAYQFKHLNDLFEKRLLLQRYLDESKHIKHGDVRIWRNELMTLQRNIHSFSYDVWIEKGLIYHKAFCLSQVPTECE
ncbi:hypothetical protein [Acinetobacter sp. P8-3-8]|uniref:hypothetical protein n=1 Tax=Acinetobacter sp. P8-3-8 TaxID=1029823 RepID=UPI000248534C|nr:hypothetical protein [Acinetobacter sp. P8-3-8]